jgi:hypothetical protein
MVQVCAPSRCMRIFGVDLDLQLAVTFRLIESRRALLVAPSIRPHSPLYPSLYPLYPRSGLLSMSLYSTHSPKRPSGLLSRCDAFVSSTCSFASLLGHIPSYPAPSITFRRPQLTLTPPDSHSTSKCPLGPVIRLGTFVSPTLMFMSLLGHSWVLCGPYDAAVSPPGSSRAFPGEVSSISCFKRERSCSDAPNRISHGLSLSPGFRPGRAPIDGFSGLKAWLNIFPSLSPRKPSPSRGFQAKPGRHITTQNTETL